MRRFLFLFCMAFFILALPLASQQEEASLDWDIDTIFDEPPQETVDGETAAGETSSGETGKAAAPAPSPPSVIAALIKRRGLRFESSFDFTGGMAPGWKHAPWHLDDYTDEENDFSKSLIVKMRAYFVLDSQISKDFHVRLRFYYQIPNNSLTLTDFYVDYTLYDSVFFRAGKYNYSWGISNNFIFTNLIARIPADRKFWREPFIFRADVPIGVGGFQLLTLTRRDLLNGDFEFLGWRDFAYGGKYNLALQWADFDLGALYQYNTPLKGFLSVKTTLWGTEFYNEYLLSADIDNNWKTEGAVNLGFMREFFGGKLSINGELYYSNEKNALWYNAETSFRDAFTSPLADGFNMALNLLYRFGGKGNPRLFLQSRYAPAESSALLVPGFRITPWPYFEFYLAVPMALGNREGYYYAHNFTDPKNRPFSVLLLLRLRGSVRAEYYY